MSALGLPSWTDGHATLTVGLADGAPVVQLETPIAMSRVVLPTQGRAALEVAEALRLAAGASLAGLHSTIDIWHETSDPSLAVFTGPEGARVTLSLGACEVKLTERDVLAAAEVLSAIARSMRSAWSAPLPLEVRDDVSELHDGVRELPDGVGDVLDGGVAGLGVPVAGVAVSGAGEGSGGLDIPHGRSLSGSGSQAPVASDGPAGSGGGAPGSGERTVGDTPDTAPAPMTGAVSGPQTSDEAPDQTPSRGSSASGVVGTFPSGASSEPTECEPARYSGCCCGGCSL